MEEFIQRLIEIGGGFCIQNMHVKNEVCTFLPEVLDQDISLLLGDLRHHFWIYGLG